MVLFVFVIDTATPYIYTLSLHDALPISWKDSVRNASETGEFVWNLVTRELGDKMNETSAPVDRDVDEFPLAGLTAVPGRVTVDRKSTRLNSSHRCISYAVFCLKKKTKPQ